MSRKKLFASGVLCLLALAIACGKRSQSPISPTSSTPSDSAANADGSTLKATAPTPESPVNNVQLTEVGVTLVVQNASLKFGKAPLNYRFEVYDEANKKVYEGLSVGSSGGTTSHAVSGILEFNKPHTWRSRAEYLGAVGPWSVNGSFRTAEGGYIRGTEIYDPLANGKTVGETIGSYTWVPGTGIRFNQFGARIAYILPEALQAGEYSFLATGIDEGSPGEKSKVMTMAEGWGDPTANDYRFSAELRARNYPEPGTIRFRMIVGDASNASYIRDSPRRQVGMSDEIWYLWRLTWDNGWGRLEVREGGPNGPAIYDWTVSTNGHPYRPNPHVIYVGAPIGRGGEDDSTIPGLTVRNVWLSSRPRPANY